MSPEKKTFVAVDELMPKITLERAAEFYGTTLPELHRIGAETRTRCFLTCGRTGETGDRVLAIQEGHPAKQWHCHQYGCGKGGNLVSFCDLLKPGTPAGGRPRGERFKAIAADLAAMVAGCVRGVDVPRPGRPVPPPEAPAANVPLKDSPNERARALTDLDRKFVLDVAAMPPQASRYFRCRPFLSPEVCRAFRVGYLPRDSGEDKSGGTMRGRVVYPYLSEASEILTWFGRDPEFEEKYQKWEAGGKTEREPEKFHFVKGFHRGLELWGQHLLKSEEVAEKVKGLGVILVEGPNDVIRLSTLGVPAVALCGNTITQDQAEKAARLAREVAGGLVTIMLDCDEAGEQGMRQALWVMAERCSVRLVWTSGMHEGKFKGRQPESLSAREWEIIRLRLVQDDVVQQGGDSGRPAQD